MEVGTNNENRPLLPKGKGGKNVPWGVQVSYTALGASEADGVVEIIFLVYHW